jgi:hypothetical protein
VDNIEALKKSQEVNGARSHLWAKVLVVGLALEVAVLLAFREGKSWVETVAGVFTALLVAVSVGLEIHFGKKADKAFSELQQISEENIAEAHARAAEANQIAEQERLARLQIEARLEPRWISVGLFDEALKGKPTGTAKIVYLRDDGEAFSFAMGLCNVLKVNGWIVFPPEPVSQSADPLFSRFPTLMSVQGQPLGVTVVTKMGEPDPIEQKTPITPLHTLCDAFLTAGFGVALGFDATFPLNCFRIVVGPKP